MNKGIIDVVQEIYIQSTANWKWQLQQRQAPGTTLHDGSEEEEAWFRNSLSKKEKKNTQGRRTFTVICK